MIGSFFDLIDRHGHCHSKSPHAASPPVDEHYIPPVLSTAPDSIFAIILYAASCLLVARYTMFLQLNIRDPVFLYTAEALLARLNQSLDSLAVSDNHAPRRAAAVVRQLEQVWREKVVKVIAAGQLPTRTESECDLPFGKCYMWAGSKHTSYQPADADADADTDAAEQRTAGISLPVSAERDSAAPQQAASAPDPLPFPAGPGPLFDPGFDAFSMPTLAYGTPWVGGAQDGSGHGAGSGSAGVDGFPLPDSDSFWASFMANLASPQSA